MRRFACMVVHAYFPDDPRVRREAEALLEDGWELDIVCLRGDGEAREERWRGATVYRIPVRRHRGGGLAVYLLEYGAFGLLAALRLARLAPRRRYSVAQAHNMPDFLVFTALLPRLLGARVVLDIHDLVPELYAAKFGGHAGHPLVRLTRLAERASVAYADRVITAGEPFRRRLVERGVPAEKISVVMNAANPRLFAGGRQAGAQRDPGRFTLMYHGGLFARYGLDVAIEAVALLRDRAPELRLEIYGRGEASDDLARLIAARGLEGRVRLGGFLPLDQIPALIARADLGVVPYHSNPFTDMLYPTKAFEYLAMGVPVVASRTAAVAELFGAIPDMFFAPGDAAGLSGRVLALRDDRARLARLLAAQRSAYAPHSWERQRARYLDLMAGLALGRRAATRPERS